MPPDILPQLWGWQEVKLNCLPSRSAWDPALGPDVPPTWGGRGERRGCGEEGCCFFLSLCSLWFLSFWFLWCGWLKKWAPGTVGIRRLFLRCFLAFLPPTPNNNSLGVWWRAQILKKTQRIWLILSYSLLQRSPHVPLWSFKNVLKGASLTSCWNISEDDGMKNTDHTYRVVSLWVLIARKAWCPWCLKN